MVYVNTAEYLYAVLGGVLLGIATSFNYIMRGKVTGMSGIVYGIVSFNKKEWPEKLTIVGGMLLISGIFFDIFGYSTNSQSIIPFGPKQDITAGTSYLGLAIAGFLVGFGTKLSNGCTSGHGLCGLPRFSIRSFIAVGVFLVTAIAIATINAYAGGLGALTNTDLTPTEDINNMVTANFFIFLGVLMPIFGYHAAHKTENFNIKAYITEHVIVYITGIVFGMGLMISGMTRRSKIQHFLQLNSNWDPSLLFVLCSGVLVNLATFNYMIRVKKTPVIGGQLVNPSSTQIDWKLIGGAFAFGLGWGIGFLCPGPFIMLYSVFTIGISLLWGTCLILGMYCANYLTTLPKSKVDSRAENNKDIEVRMNPINNPEGGQSAHLTP